MSLTVSPLVSGSAALTNANAAASTAPKGRKHAGPSAALIAPTPGPQTLDIVEDELIKHTSLRVDQRAGLLEELGDQRLHRVVRHEPGVGQLLVRDRRRVRALEPLLDRDAFKGVSI